MDGRVRGRRSGIGGLRGFGPTVVGGTVIAALVLAGCGSKANSGATAEPGRASTTAGATVAAADPASEIDDPTCAVLTVADVSRVLGSAVTEKAVKSPQGCQWLGDTVVNGFLFKSGTGSKSIAGMRREWPARGGTVTTLSGLGDEAIVVVDQTRIRYVAFRVGENGMQFQSNATTDQLKELGRLAATQL